MSNNGEGMIVDNKRYMSAVQRKMLINFVRSNPYLLLGKFTKDFTRHDAQALWESVTKRLNKIPGAVKEWNQWRKSYHDLKSSQKTKLKRIRVYKDCTRNKVQRYSYLTNEYQNQPSLETTESKILNETDVLHSNVESVKEETICSDHEENQYTDIQYLEDSLDHRIQHCDEEFINSKQTEYENIQCDIPSEESQQVFSPIEYTNNENDIGGTTIGSDKKKSSRMPLDNSITQRMEQTREQYQRQKLNIAEKRLHLYEREVIAKERMAAALESLAASLNSK